MTLHSVRFLQFYAKRFSMQYKESGTKGFSELSSERVSVNRELLCFVEARTTHIMHCRRQHPHTIMIPKAHDNESSNIAKAKQ
jgi:hypothetical protein